MTSTVAAAASARTAVADHAKGDVLVIFGITGDLAKVMTFRSLYRLEARGLLDCPIVGVAVDDWTEKDLRERAHTSIEGAGETIDPAVFHRVPASPADISGGLPPPGPDQPARGGGRG